MIVGWMFRFFCVMELAACEMLRAASRPASAPKLVSSVPFVAAAATPPVATPPNTLILGPGKFHFMDYVKVGLPLVLVSMIVCTVIIPLVWPF